MISAEPSLEAIFFDFDGVLVDSVDIKKQAFKEVIAPHANGQLDACMEYFMTQGGISRVVKFEHVWTKVLQNPRCHQSVDRLAREFAHRVIDRTCHASFIPGSREFLTRYARRLPLYVISGTPEEELRSIVERREMTDCFQGVFGSPRSKVQIGESILAGQHYLPSKVCFIGDATTDRDAARTLGIRFVGFHGPHLSPYLDGSEQMIADLRFLEQALWPSLSVE
ncbi:HAD family hydrolase [bacterium]|nr:HAD family hydrolase [bacterium]